MEVLFKIGDRVRHLGDGEECTVLGITITPDDVIYKISSFEWDAINRKPIDGHKTVRQEELEAAPEEAAETPEEEANEDTA